MDRQNTNGYCGGEICYKRGYHKNGCEVFNNERPGAVGECDSRCNDPSWRDKLQIDMDEHAARVRAGGKA